MSETSRLSFPLTLVWFLAIGRWLTFTLILFQACSCWKLRYLICMGIVWHTLHRQLQHTYMSSTMSTQTHRLLPILTNIHQYSHGCLIWSHFFLGGSKAPGYQEYFALLEKSFEKRDVWCQWHWHWEVLCQRQLAGPSIPLILSVLPLYSITSLLTSCSLQCSRGPLDF